MPYHIHKRTNTLYDYAIIFQSQTRRRGEEEDVRHQLRVRQEEKGREAKKTQTKWLVM